MKIEESKSLLDSAEKLLLPVVQDLSARLIAFLKRPDVIEFLRGLPIAIERMERLPRDMQGAFAESGFPPSIRLTMSDLADIQQARERGDNAFIAKFIEDHCLEVISIEEQRDNLLRRWGENPLLARRMHILREGIEAASAGRYVLAVAALLPQIEGIVADGSSHTGSMAGSQYRRLIDNLSHSDPHFGEIFRNFVRDVLLTSFEHGSPPDVELSRHAVAHGGDVDFGTRRNAARVITAIDYIQSAFASVQSVALETSEE